MWRRCAVRGGVAVAVAMAILAGAASAEEPAAPSAANPPEAAPQPWRWQVLPDQWKLELPESSAVRVGAITRDEEIARLTLREAIGLALQNNPQIAAQRLEPLRQSEGVLQAQSQYDPLFSGNLTSNQSNTLQGNALQVGTNSNTGAASALNTDQRDANFHLFKMFRPGTQATVDLLNDRLDTNSRFTSLRPQYKPQMNLSIVQPLLRGFGWDFSYLVVKQAEETADQALFQYEANLADFVRQVIEDYWAVVGAREQVEVQKQSKALADRTVEENEARVKVGLLPPVSVLEAQADAASREEQVLIAENNLALTMQTLAQIVYYRPAGTFVPRTIEPAEELTPEKVKVDLDDTLGNALANRPEVAASARGIRVQQLNERVAGNALLPKLDLAGGYGVNGLSGASGITTNTTTFFAQTNQTRPGCACSPTGNLQLPFLCQCQIIGPSSPIAGGWDDAYRRLRSNDFYSYSFGLQFQVPIGNAAAQSQYSQARIARDQAELNHRQLLSSVTLEARQTVNDVLTARQRIDTTRVARELAEENLKNQQKRHEVGMATTKDLLDFQSRLTTARAAEIQAKIDYATALARWRRAQGRLLAEYQIVIRHPGERSAPWFAKF